MIEKVNHKTFQAKPAPRSTYPSKRTEDKLPQSRVLSRRKVPSPSISSISSLSSLKPKKTLPKTSVQQSLSDLKNSKDPFSEFKWLTGSLDASGDCPNPVDTKLTPKSEKLKDSYGLPDWDTKTSAIMGLKQKDAILKESESTKWQKKGLEQSCGSKPSKTSVSCQSMGAVGSRIKNGLDLMNSEFIKRGLGLQPTMGESNYSHIGGKLKYHRMK